MTAEELLKYKKMYAFMAIAMAILLIATLLTLIYLTKDKGFSPLLSIPFSLSVFVIIHLKKLNEVKKEIAARKYN